MSKNNFRRQRAIARKLQPQVKHDISQATRHLEAAVEVLERLASSCYPSPSSLLDPANPWTNPDGSGGFLLRQAEFLADDATWAMETVERILRLLEQLDH